MTPKVSLKQFPAGPKVSGKFAWEAEVAGFVEGKHQVEFRVDANTDLPHALRWTERFAPFVCNGDGQQFDSSTLANGPHRFGVVVREIASGKNLSNLFRDVVVDNTVVVVPPPPPTAGFSYPASFYRWGSHIAAAYLKCDMVAVLTPTGDAKGAKKTNTGLIVLCAPHRPGAWYHFLYGDGLDGHNSGHPWPGGGGIRAWEASDRGCTQADKIPGFAVHNATTAKLVADVTIYGWDEENLGDAHDGIHSDNVFFLRDHLSQFYGSCYSGKEAAFVDGLASIGRAVRASGVPIVGGNVVRTNSDEADAAVLGSMNHIMDENLNQTISNGPDSVAQTIGLWTRWHAAQTGPAYGVIRDSVGSSPSAARLRYGLAIACICGAAYNPVHDWLSGADEDFFYPDEMTKDGQRGWLGQRVGTPIQHGSGFTQNFVHPVTGPHTAVADISARTGSLQ